MTAAINGKITSQRHSATVNQNDVSGWNRPTNAQALAASGPRSSSSGMDSEKT